jgi:hypothetical protein
MSKKLFALAGCTALAGAVFTISASGCSSTTTVSPDTDSGTTTPVDSGKPKPTDSGSSGDTDTGAPTCPTTDPITSADIDGQIGWKPAAAIQNVCTPTDLSKLEANFNSGTANTFLDLVAGLVDPCKSCILTPKTAAAWGPIVTFTDDGQQGIVNFGACYSVAVSPNCGKFNEYVELCIDSACADCPANDDTAFNACVQKAIAKTGACSGPITDAQGACGSDTTTADKACGDVIDGASVLCTGGTYDGGVIDGGT